MREDKDDLRVERRRRRENGMGARVKDQLSDGEMTDSRIHQTIFCLSYLDEI